jgi:hypothetical protein
MSQTNFKQVEQQGLLPQDAQDAQDAQNAGQPQQVSGHHFPWVLMLGLLLFVCLIVGGVLLATKYRGVFGGFLKPAKDLLGVYSNLAGIGVELAGTAVNVAGGAVEGIGTVIEIAQNGKKPSKKPCTAFEKDGVKLRDDGTSCWAVTIPAGGIGIIPEYRTMYAPGSTEQLYRPCEQGSASGLNGKGDCILAADSYGRGTGYVSEERCKDKRKVSSCTKYGGLWYEKCRSGYTNSGCCICVRPKRVYTKEADRKYCPDTHKHLWGGRCYTNCKENWHHSGAFCHVDTGKGGAKCPPEKGPKDFSEHTLLLGALCYKPCPKDYKQVTPELCEPPGGMGIKATLKARQFCPPNDPNLAAYTKLVAGLCYKPGSEPTVPNFLGREVRSIGVASQSVNMEKEKRNGEQLREMSVRSRRPHLQRVMPRGVCDMRL